MNKNLSESKLSVIGLGYVGLPLALEFGQKYNTVGFDINQSRVVSLVQGIDATKEVSPEDFKTAEFCKFSSDDQLLADRDVYIVTVPTPIDKNNKPDLSPLRAASRTVGKYLDRGNIIIFESTVFPGATEEICVPILEEISGLKYNEDFFAGYSPERINPGDKDRRLKDIVKVTSGSTPEAAEFVDCLYGSIINAGTFKAKSIAIAEAAKVIENTQRDVNISFVNELELIFDRIGIDTTDVIEAAGTKWNFLKYQPGLVGGHCIGVDPYYLTHKAESIGYKPKIILAGRKINDNMGSHVALELKNQLKKKNIKINEAKILIMGLTFKENCPDIRNSGVQNIITELKKFECSLDLQDPWVDQELIKKNFGIKPNSQPSQNIYDGIIIAVAHNEFKTLGLANIKNLCKKNHVIFDLKNLFNSNQVDFKL